MKKLYFLITGCLLCCGLDIAQTPPKFKLTKDGIQPVVLIFGDNYDAKTIYTRVKEWISLHNQYPKSVTKVDQENQMLKFSGYKENGWRIKNNENDYWNELRYTLVVEIKDARCRVTFATEDTRYKVWFNKDGSLIKNFKVSLDTFEASVNETLASLYEHIKGVKKKADNW